MKELIRTLVEAWGPSGFEHGVRALIREEVSALADEIQVDALGNLICRVGTKQGEGKRVLVAAHMDEIGIIISHIDQKGYLRFSNIGGVFASTLHGNRVKFENGALGTISVEDFWGSNTNRLPALGHYYVDVADGANVQVGDAAIFWRNMELEGNRVIAKSLDDRIGCVVAIEAMRRLKEEGTPHECYFVFTTQEEVGTRGAQTAAYALEPDLGIALDVTATGDTPKSLRMDVKVGAGAAIKLMDRRHIVPPEVRDLMLDTAARHNIPHQREVLEIGTTDASSVQVARAGVPSGCISIPARNIHTTSEVVDLGDVEACIALLVALLNGPLPNLRPS